MAITVTTNVYPSSIVFTFEGAWAWQQLFQAIDQSKSYLQSMSEGTPVIFDLTLSEGIPRGGLTRIPEIMKRAHKNAGFAVCVSDQNSHTARLLHEMITMIERIYGISWDVRYVNHYQEAIKHIEMSLTS